MEEKLIVATVVSLILASCAVIAYTVIESIKWMVYLNIPTTAKLFVITFSIVFVFASICCLFQWLDERGIPDRRGS